MQRKKLIATLMAVMMFVLPITSLAYTNQQYGWSSPSIPIVISTSSSYKDLVKKSMTAWNNSISEVNIYEKKKATNTVLSGSYTDTWVGAYSYYLRSGKTYKFNIYLNDRLLSSKSNNYKQSTIVHEFGHALSLADNPPEKQSIMRYDRNRDVMTTPQQDDINGVKKYYGLK